MRRPRNFGEYELLRRVASGGMAEVYLAKAAGVAGFEKHLAIKMIRENLSDDVEFIEMLVNEAKLAVRLNHNNIVQVFDLGKIDRRYFIAMEYINGRDLHALLVKTAKQDVYVPFEVAAYIVRETCAGMHYAHNRNDEHGRPLSIVHRDISPQNILLGFAGEVKLVDFGIAKANIQRNETQVGILKGKFCYMSPEQAWGDKLDNRSDVYALGVVLYEMLTGQMLHQEEDQLKLLEQVRRAQILPPTSIRREIPSDLEAICMQALERDRADRFPSAAAFGQELTRYLALHAPTYAQSDLARYFCEVFDEERADDAAELRARDVNLSTRNVAIEVMDRNEFKPDSDASLVHSFSHLQAIARQGMGRPVASQHPEQRARSAEDSTRPVVLREAGFELPPPGEEGQYAYARFGDDDEEPTQAYTPFELAHVLNGNSPQRVAALAAAAALAATASDDTTAPRDWIGQIPEKRDWQPSRDPSSEAIVLSNSDLLPLTVHDQAQHRAQQSVAPKAQAVSSESAHKPESQRRPAAPSAPRSHRAPAQQHHPAPGKESYADATLPLNFDRDERVRARPRNGQRGPAKSKGGMTGLWLAVLVLLLLGVAAVLAVVIV